MSPKEAIAYHFSSVFQVLNGFDYGYFFTWKAIALILCSYLAWRNPIKYFWGGLFLFGMAPCFLLLDQSDLVSRFVRVYLVWMCAEVSFRSLAVDAEARIVGWWLFPVLCVFVL